MLISVFACGKVDPGGAPSPRGGGGNAAGDAGAGSGIGGNAGNGEETNGGSSGAPVTPVAGSTNTTEGGATGTGGDGPWSSSGEGGNSGEGGSSAEGGSGGAGELPLGCEGTYDVCGCGCCGEALNAGCYYPELGDRLSEIEAEDRAFANSPSCAQAGCASGVRMMCCERPEEEDASYTVTGYSADALYFIVSRQTAKGRCTTAIFAQPGAPQEGFPLDVLSNGSLAIHRTGDGACTMVASPTRSPIGALGSFALASPTEHCAFQFDFTLFFLTDHGTVDAVRFKADRVLLAGHDDGDC